MLSASLSLSFSLSVKYLFVRADAVRVGNTLKTESLKQPRPDTQLTHSLLISPYTILFVRFVVAYEEGGRRLSSSEAHMFVSDSELADLQRHTFKNSEPCSLTRGGATL